MSSYELGIFWEQILEKTKETIPQAIWEKVIYSGLFPSSATDSVLTLYAMHDFIRHLLEGNKDIMMKLSQAASDIAGTPITVEIMNMQTETNSYANSTETNGYTPPTETNTHTSPVEMNPYPIPDEVMPQDISGFDESLYDDPITVTSSYQSKRAQREEFYSQQDPFMIPDATPMTQPTMAHHHTTLSQVAAMAQTGTVPPTGRVPLNDRVSQSTTLTPTGTIGSNETTILYPHQLNKAYTFDNFVVGNSNRVAYSAAQHVAENPAMAYNPLFIYGESGLGKTHLMHAIGNYILSQNPAMRICCISSETFVNDLINAIRHGHNEAFRRKYRDIDVLLVDDIQFLQSKEYTQTEFFHTFNTLQNEGKQIVLTSDTMPSDIKSLPPRLQSRFEGGFTVKILAPDLETRTAILRDKLDKEMRRNPQLHIGDDLLTFIAAKIPNNIRTLEGAFSKVVNTASISGNAITSDFVIDVIKDLISDTAPALITIDMIQECICEAFKIKLEDLLGKKRNKQLVYPRQIAMYLCRHLVNASYPTIADSFGKRDHSTIMHAYEKIDREIHESTTTKQHVEEIIGLLKNKSY